MSSAWIVEHTRAILSITDRPHLYRNGPYTHWRVHQRIPQPTPTPPNHAEVLIARQSLAIGRSNSNPSSRVLHIQLEREEDMPVPIGGFLGRGAMSEVHQVNLNGVLYALKRRRIVRRNVEQELRAFQKEYTNMEKVVDHQHVTKMVATFKHSRLIGLLMWPVATCDLGTFFDDVDPLWTLYERSGKDGCVARSEIEHTIGAEATGRLEALQVLHTDNSGQCTFFPVYLRISRSFGCLAGALAYLHSQEVKHKDLKPSNILLTADNIFITDFGTSTDFSADGVSITDTWGGTPKYFAPEVAAFQPSGRSADVFSLGCIFLEMRYIEFGRPLEMLHELRPRRDRSFQANLELLPSWFDPVGGVDSRFRGLIVRMLEPVSTARPSAREVLAGLLALRFEYSRGTNRDYHDAYFGACCARSTFVSQTVVSLLLPRNDIQ